MKTNIIVFGETSNKNSIQLEKEYIKRISPFSRVEYITLQEEKMGKTISEEQIKKKEADKFFEIFNKINKNKNIFLVACHVKGKEFTSEQFAQKLKDVENTFAGIAFVIGGSLGLSDEILQSAHLQLSFSRMTFPHDLFRTFLFITNMKYYSRF